MRFVGPPHGMPTHFGHGGRGRGGRGFRHFGRRGGFVGPGYVGYPYPYFWPDGYYPSSPVPPPSPTQIVVVPPPAPPPAPPAPPAPSLMLEYQDGHWVRVPMGTEVPTSVSAVHRASPASSTPTSRKDTAIEAEETAKPVPPLPHAVLVFRNGSRLELQRYEIRNGFIYASGDYWDTSLPARRIAISELNVPATLRLNQQLGSKFRLPSSPDEVFVSF